ncbi:MAG: magnesium chelatase, partial [Acidobacteria bacterium]|nr:magnesium chelatase [Acidobacteriota bacterium]
EITPRISDIYAAVPSMTGKMELEYEGEQVGANRIAKDLIKRAAGEIFEGYFVGIDFARTVHWFDEGNNLRLADTASSDECRTLVEAVPDLIETSLIPFDIKKADVGQMVAACEFVLEGLYAQNKISRNEEGGYTAVTKAKKDRRGMIYDDLTESSKYS